MHTILDSCNCDCNADEVPLPVVISSSILAKASICATCLDMRSQSAEVPAPTEMEGKGREGKGRKGNIRYYKEGNVGHFIRN